MEMTCSSCSSTDTPEPANLLIECHDRFISGEQERERQREQQKVKERARAKESKRERGNERESKRAREGAIEREKAREGERVELNIMKKYSKPILSNKYCVSTTRS